MIKFLLLSCILLLASCGKTKYIDRDIEIILPKFNTFHFCLKYPSTVYYEIAGEKISGYKSEYIIIKAFASENFSKTVTLNNGIKRKIYGYFVKTQYDNYNNTDQRWLPANEVESLIKVDCNKYEWN